jgi:hypothetical protein
MAAAVDDTTARRWDRLVTMTDRSDDQSNRIRTTRPLSQREQVIASLIRCPDPSGERTRP